MRPIPEIDLPRLPLDSSRWVELSSNGIPHPEEAPRLLRQMESASTFAEAWNWLYEGPLELGEVCNEATYAVLPHAVMLAAKQDPRTLSQFWWRIAYIANSYHDPGIQCKPMPIPPDLEAGFRAAMRVAESLAIRCFCCREWQEEASDLAIACLALSHHPVGGMIWQAPYPPKYGPEFVRFDCLQCGEEELWFTHTGDGIAAILDEDAVPTEPDPDQPEPQAPPLPDLSAIRRLNHPWLPIAKALNKPLADLCTVEHGAPFPKNFTDRFADHIRVAAAVADAGVPKKTPNRAVLCLVGMMVALSGAFDWASRLLRLAGFVRCPICANVDSWAAGMPFIPVDLSEETGLPED